MQSDDMLKATIVARGSMDEIAECMKLGCRVDCVTLSAVGTLIHDDSGWTAMSVDESGNRRQWKVLNQTLPGSSDVGLVEQRL